MRKNLADTRLVLDRAKVKSLRISRGLTQAQAATRAGIRGGSARWNDIETGRRANVTIDTLNRIGKALGVSARDLLK